MATQYHASTILVVLSGTSCRVGADDLEACNLFERAPVVADRENGGHEY
jgi:hypothetical protein